MQGMGHSKEFAAKPMLRIVNMQKRLRPVYTGDGATDFAIDDRDLRLLDPPVGRWFMQVADYFGIQLQIAFNRGAAFLQCLPVKLTHELTDAGIEVYVASQLLL
jgi:hypothetical protein